MAAAAGQQPKTAVKPPEPTRQLPDDAKNPMYSRNRTRARKRLMQLEQKLQNHIDCEDRRVKELTEAILYDFLPAALNFMLPHCEDPLQELDPEKCRAVAGAALAVSALMNAPPGFLEFLLCVPWKKLSQLYPRSDSLDKLIQHLHVADDERQKLVNTRIDPGLMPTILDFLYRDEHVDSVPPMLHLTASPSSPKDLQNQVDVRLSAGVSIETVAALLDGATPLHCAALRGNPAQVDHLLYCGADPSVRTTAGELPIELVPVCGDRNHATGHRACRCMGPHDQEVWECRSRLARSLIARRCLWSFRVGLFSYCKLILFCFMCCFGAWGCYTTVLRPAVEEHMVARRERKRQEACARAHGLTTKLRTETQQGRIFLDTAKHQRLKPPPPPPKDADANVTEPATSVVEELDCEKAFKCFVRAVHALQSLDLQGDTLPQVFAESDLPDVELIDAHILEDEQANLYCCWAESVLLKFRSCTCPGCAALAVQAVRMAHIQATRLFARVEKKKQADPDRWRAVGQALARVVHSHICLLLDTEAQASPTRASVFRAEQCLKEWDKLVKCGLTEDVTTADKQNVCLLQTWAKTADSDLYIAEALLGNTLTPSQTLEEVISTTITHSPNGLPYLARNVTAEVVQQLDYAITLACTPSVTLSELAKSVARNAECEINAAVQLREVVNSKGLQGTCEAVQALTDAIEAAELYPRLSSEVESARALRERWLKRAEAIDRLEAVMEEVRLSTISTFNTKNVSQPDSGLSAGISSSGFDLGEWEQRMKVLDAAINDAKEANISVNKAKRLLKELQAQAAAVEAARNLDAVMTKKPCGSAALKSALLKAEAAATCATGSSAGVPSFSDVLLPRIQCGRRRLEVEKAAEVLHKAALNCKAVADLPKLEAAILNARKVGAEELDTDAYKNASDLRAKLHEASKARQALEAAVKNLQKQQRQEDAEAVERALTDANRWEDLLAADVAKAKEALEQWRSQTASEARLSRALREGAGAGQLSRAIQEASAAGVKVLAAKRVLKLMQSLESTLQTIGEGGHGQCAQLKSKVEAAEQGGVAASLLEPARKVLRKMMIAETKEVLEASIKRHSDWSVLQRVAALRSALDRVEEVLAENVNGVPSVTIVVESDTVSDSGSHIDSLSHADSAMHSTDDGLSTNEQEAAIDANVTEYLLEGTQAALPLHDRLRKLIFQESTSETTDPVMAQPDDDTAVLCDLARKAWKLLEDDQRELIRQEKERQEQERARREQLERERRERERIEKEKAIKEKAEKQDRERQAAEKRQKKVDRSVKTKLDVKTKQTAPPAAAASVSAVHVSTSAAAAARAAANEASDVPGSVRPKPDQQHAPKPGKGESRSEPRVEAKGELHSGKVGVRAAAAAPPQESAVPAAPETPAVAPASEAPSQQLVGATSAFDSAPAAVVILAEAPVTAVSAPVLPSYEPSLFQTSVPFSDQPAMEPVMLEPLHIDPGIPEPVMFDPSLLDSMGLDPDNAGLGAMCEPMAVQLSFIQHSRGDSVESLGDATLLNQAMLEALDMDDSESTTPTSSAAAAAGVLAAPWEPATGANGVTTTADMKTAGMMTESIPSQSSVYSSGATADELLSPMLDAEIKGLDMGNNMGKPRSFVQSLRGSMNGTSSVAGGATAQLSTPKFESTLPAMPTTPAVGSKAPRFGYVDLGGASWGVENALTGNAAGQQSLFPSLQSGIDFSTMLGKAEHIAPWQAASTALNPSDPEFKDMAQSSCTTLSMVLGSDATSQLGRRYSVPSSASLASVGSGSLAQQALDMPLQQAAAASQAAAAASQQQAAVQQQVQQQQQQQAQQQARTLTQSTGTGNVMLTGNVMGNVSVSSRPGAFWVPPNFSMSKSEAELLQQQQLISSQGQGQLLQPGATRLEWGTDGNGMPTTMVSAVHGASRSPRPCRYFMHGFCRDGDRCRFHHPSGVGVMMQGQVVPGQTKTLLTSTAGMSRGTVQTVPASAAPVGGSAFAFGAPGNDVFSSSDVGGYTKLVVPAGVTLGSRGTSTLVNGPGQLDRQNAGLVSAALLSQLNGNMQNAIGGRGQMQVYQHMGNVMQMPEMSQAPALPDELTFSPPSMSPRTGSQANVGDGVVMGGSTYQGYIVSDRFLRG